MPEIRELLSDVSAHAVYFALALTILPTLVLARWYHARIRRTQGGRELLQRHSVSDLPMSRDINQASRSLVEGVGIARDIGAGRYGDDVRKVHNTVYLWVSVWLATLVLVFGLFIRAGGIDQP